jgi:hypothetical protein
MPYLIKSKSDLFYSFEGFQTEWTDEPKEAITFNHEDEAKQHLNDISRGSPRLRDLLDVVYLDQINAFKTKKP